MSSDKKLSILGHLREAKRRLLYSVLAVILTTTASFIFADQIFAILKAPAGNIAFIFLDISEGMSTYMQVCLISGLILAAPYIIYQLLVFLLPALSGREKKALLLVVPWVVLMFAGGVAFGYFVLIPPAMGFLVSFGQSIATPQIRIGTYVAFVAKLLLSIGLVFEFPVITTFLTRAGVINPSFLAGKRRIAIVLAFIVAAIITPTVDPVNMSLVAVPLCFLYELSIWLSKLVYPRKNRQLVLET